MADNLGNLSITGYRYCYNSQWDGGSYASLKSAYSGTNSAGVSVCVDKITLPSFTNAKYKQPFTITYKPSILLGATDSSTSGTLKAYLCSSNPCGSAYASNTATAPSSYIGSGSVNYSGLTQGHQYFPVNITVSSTDLTSGGTYYIWIYTSSFTQIHYDAKVTGTLAGTLQTYTISYNANGGTGAPSSQTKTYGTTLTLSSNKPTKSNSSSTGYKVTFNTQGGSSVSAITSSKTTTYTFSKWNTKSDGSGTSYNAGASYTANAAATLYAQYTSSTSNGAIKLPSAPTKSGYSFSGWYDAASGGNKIGNAGASYTPTKAITLYAHWTANTGKVTINGSNYGTVKDANNNSIASGSSVSYGTVLTITPTAATGYTTTAKVNTGSISNNKYTVNSDVTITFTRTENTYYVYYNNGLATSGTLPNTTSRTYTKNATIGTNNMSKTSTTEDSYTVTYNKGTSTSGTVPEKQTSTNTTTYTKNGWTTSSSNTNDLDYANGATYGANTTNNLTLYPNFSTSVTNSGITLKTNSMAKSTTTDATYTITYNANNGSVNPSSDTAYKKTSYAANGWTTTSGSSTRTYANNANTGALSTNLTLYPCFTPTTTTDSLNLPTPTRSNYTFNGWYTSASGGTQITSPYTPTQTRTLYAHWSINQCTVTFDPNGGTASFTSKTVNAGSRIGNLPTATRDGYTLKGWYTTATGGQKISTYTTISSDKTYYAQWTANTYTVAFDSNGGIGTMSNQSFTYGVSQALKANTFTRTGYVFSGWSYNGNIYTDKQSVNNLTTVNNGTITMVAIWKLAVYNLTIKPNGGTLLSNNTTNDIVTKFAYDRRTYVGKRTESISYSINTGSNNSISESYSSGAKLYYSDSYVDPNTNGGKLELLNPTQLTSISSTNCNNYLKGKYILFNNKMYLISSTASFTGTSIYSRILKCSSAALCTISENISYDWKSNNAAEKENYVFTGYSTSAGSVSKNTSGASFYFDGGGENSYDPWGSSSESYVFDGNATSDVVITAEFRKKRYYVQYELNNSKITTQSSFQNTYDYGNTFTFPSFNSTPIYEFLGWNTAANGSGTAYLAGASASNLTSEDGAVITLYAQWKLKNLIKLHTGGASFENAQVYIWERDETGEAKWRLATAYIYINDNDRWKMSTGN